MTIRITRPAPFLVCVLLAGTQLDAASQPKYGAKVVTVQAAALAKTRTYQWTTSRPALDKKTDALIVVAVDRQLGLRGLTKVTSGVGDLVVTYDSLTRADADPEAKASKTGALPTLNVGTLVVDLKDAAKGQLLFRVRVDTPLEGDPATFEATVNAAVAAIFEKYPAPSKR